MTREESIWAMQFYKEKLYNGIFNQYIGAFDVAISALKEQPRWISVDERLPEETGVYLVYDISMGIRVFYFGKGEVRSGWFNVTHWMPLPEPPEVEV